MADSARDSDAILAAARSTLNQQRAGGRRVQGAIGQRSAAIRREAQWRQLRKIMVALIAGLALIGMGSFILHAISTILVVVVLALIAVAVLALGRQTAVKIPKLDDLRKAPAKTLVGNTQLWLEAQRPALPAPALNLVGQIGGQLDLLGTQLDKLDESTPAVAQVRTLVGQNLPDLVNAYTAIPQPLRSQKQGDASPDEQLAASLGRISTEIDSVTRQLAEGSIDNLAIQTRFLDYKYGGDEVSKE